MMRIRAMRGYVHRNGAGMLGSWVACLLAAGMLALSWPGATTAEETKAEKSTVEEILDILQTRGVINEQEHNELLERAKAEAEEKKAPHDFRLYWKEGIRLDSQDEAFKLKLGGRIMVDWAYFWPDTDTEAFLGEEFGSGWEARRARLYMEGTVYDRVEFKSQFDFAGGDADIKDLYVGLKGIPYIGRARVGHLKEPVSLEQMTSSKYITFMERSLMDALIPGRNVGISLFDNLLDDRLGWSFGFYRETDDYAFGFSDAANNNLSLRLRGVPWYAEDGRKLIHLGLSYSHRFLDQDKGTNIRYRERPEAHLSPVRYVDTGSFFADSADLINPEFALVYGPFSLQGEYTAVFNNRDDLPNTDFWGAYGYVSYFLTGEHRKYKGGSFSRVKPCHNFLQDGGLGAWEIAFRYSYLKLNSEEISGRRLSDFTAGLNWYLNPNTRLMLNYIYADLHDVGNTSIVETRVQIDF